MRPAASPGSGFLGASTAAPSVTASRTPTPPGGTPTDVRRSREVLLGLPPPEEAVPARRAELLPDVPVPVQTPAVAVPRARPPGLSSSAWEHTDPQYKREAQGAGQLPAVPTASKPVPLGGGASTPRAATVSQGLTPSAVAGAPQVPPPAAPPRTPAVSPPAPASLQSPVAQPKAAVPATVAMTATAPSPSNVDAKASAALRAAPLAPASAALGSPSATSASETRPVASPQGLPASLSAPVEAVPAISSLLSASALAEELEGLPHLPASAPLVREVRARPASLWRRAGALLLDTGIVFGVLALYLELALLVVRPAGVRGPQLPGLDGFVARLHTVGDALPWAMVLGALLAVLYSSVFAFLWGGRSPGRWLFGTRLVDRRGVAPAPGRAVARALLGLVSFGLCLAGFWLSLFDRRGQTLHDKLTRTFVVRPG
jgi:uncharacterized RDD family membrane protein YckC